MQYSINRSPEVIKKTLIDDGIFPNSDLFLLIYRQAFNLPDNNGANFIEETFITNGWKNCWQAGIFDFTHYHSNTHEVLGVFCGEATVQLGGPNGFETILKKGDVLIIPAGVAHKCIRSSNRFECVGAYPNGGTYDVMKGLEKERPLADKNIENVLLPDYDPVYKNGPLQLNWEVQ